MKAYKVVRLSGRKKLSAIIRNNWNSAKCVSYYLNKKTVLPDTNKPLFCFKTIEYAKGFMMDRNNRNWLDSNESLVVYECEIKAHVGHVHSSVSFAPQTVTMILADEITLKKLV